MKLIIAHLSNVAFDAVREELRDLGVHTTTISEVHISSPQTEMSLGYRGAPMQTYLPSLKLECVTSDERSPAVVGLLRRHSGRGKAVAPRVAVLDLEELYEDEAGDDAMLDDPRVHTALY